MLALRCTLVSLLSFGLIAATGCERLQNQMYKDAIQKALHESSLTGTEPTDEHVKALKSIDLADCPLEFRTVFITYIHAWEEESAVHNAEARLRSQDGDAMGAGFLSTLFGSSTTPWSDHLRAEQDLKSYEVRADKDVSLSAQAVNDEARKYGMIIAN